MTHSKALISATMTFCSRHPGLGLCLAFICLFGPGTTASAQNRDELRYLIFDRALIETSETEEGVQVTELTALPKSDNPRDLSEYLQESVFINIEPDILNFEESISQYQEEIRQLELQGGAYEPTLSQQHLALGTLYQSAGDHESALEYLNQALHINRVNSGLFNLAQESIIEEKIESHIALGDLHAADMEQEYLFYLKRKAYGSASVELLPALHNYAEWNIFAFDSRLSMDPTLSYAAEYGMFTDNGVNNSIGEEDFRTIRLMNAQNIYRTIIQILLNNFGSSDPRLLDVEKKLALTNYFFATNLDIQSTSFNGNNSSLTMSSSQGFYDMSRVSTNSMGFRHGREALERRLQYMQRMNNIDPVELTRARIELADWLLLFKKRLAALEAYEEAYNELAASGASQEVLDEIFSPEMPQTIPTFIDYRYTRAAWNIPEDMPLEYKGWMDVRMRINRYGQPQNVELLDKSLDVTDPIELRLIRQLRSSTSYRPRFNEGKPMEEDYFEARYYYTY